MREFTKPEKLLIDKLVNLKYSNNHKDIDIAKLLRSELNVLAIELQENCNYIKLYWIRDGEGNVRERDFRQMFKVVDFLDFIRLLEEKRYIYISRLKENNVNNGIILYYDRDNYDHSGNAETGFTFCRKIGEGIIGFSYIDNSRVNTDIADLFYKYGNGLICPLQSLEDLQKHCYKTIEQRRFCKTQFATWVAIIVSILLGLLPQYCNRVEPKEELNTATTYTYKPDTLKVNTTNNNE